MRPIVLSVLLAVAGCFGGDKVAALDDDSGAPPDRGGPCELDTDCLGAGASCCGCAEYAVNRGSEWADACEDVDCPPPEPGACTGLVARCADHTCVLGCMPVGCDQTCETGFAVDAAGCLTCECAPAPVPECGVAADCARVPADCCGCALGGSDTAVPVGEVDAHVQGLDCPPEPVCPGVDVCAPDQVATCELGRCVLGVSAPGNLPAGACGTPDLPPCPPGQTCQLNSDDDATMEGVGVCR